MGCLLSNQKPENSDGVCGQPAVLAAQQQNNESDGQRAHPPHGNPLVAPRTDHNEPCRSPLSLRDAQNGETTQPHPETAAPSVIADSPLDEKDAPRSPGSTIGRAEGQAANHTVPSIFSNSHRILASPIGQTTQRFPCPRTTVAAPVRSGGMAAGMTPSQLPAALTTPLLPPSVHSSMFSSSASDFSSASFQFGTLRESVGVREPSPEKHFMQVMELEDTRAQMWAQLGVDYLAGLQAEDDVDILSMLGSPTGEPYHFSQPMMGSINFPVHDHEAGTSDVSTASLHGITSI